MKIFLISNMFPSKIHPSYGVFVQNFKEKLESRNVNFSAIAVISKKPKSGFGKFLVYLRHYMLIILKYLKNDFDLIYIHYLSHNAPVFYLILSLINNKKPIIVNIHGSDLINYNRRLFKIFNNYLIKKTSLIVIPSEYFQPLILKEFPFFKPKHIFINPSGGIDSKVFYPTPKTKISQQKEIKLGFVSRIEKGKGWNYFLKALAILNKKNINFSAIIVGDGNQTYEMTQQIKLLKLNNKVKHLGSLKQSDLREVYNDMDIFVFSSILNESLGLVGLEAMACGTPIIASNKAGAKTYVINNINGYLVKPGNHLEIALTIINYINLPITAKIKMKNEALNTANKYDSEKTANLLNKKLLSIIK